MHHDQRQPLLIVRETARAVCRQWLDFGQLYTSAVFRELNTIAQLDCTFTRCSTWTFP